MAKNEKRYDIDIDELSHDELKALYRSIRESRSSLKKHNAVLTKWASRIGAAVTALSTDGSLAFQAMAEKAGVRGHPSVTAVVRLFDAIAHPQWEKEPPPEIVWPSDWDFDQSGEWSGDADMTLNSPIAAAVEVIEHLRFSLKPEAFEALTEVSRSLQAALQSRICLIKEANGFAPTQVAGVPGVHFRDLDREQLIDLIGSLSGMALDLAQEMEFANHMLRRDLRAASYRRVAADLYRLSHISFEWGPSPKFDVMVFGGDIPF